MSVTTTASPSQRALFQPALLPQTFGITRFSGFLDSLICEDGVLPKRCISPITAQQKPADWVQMLEWRTDPPHQQEKAALVAYVFDLYWDAMRQVDPLTCLDELSKAANAIASHDVAKHIRTQSGPLLSDAIATSTRMLKFLSSGYLQKLQNTFLACFSMGSLSYGRFYSVNSNSDDPSDLNLFLVTSDGGCTLNDLLDETTMEDSVDSASRLAYFGSKPLGTSPGLLNYKLRHRNDGFVISLNIITLSAFRRLMRFPPSGQSVLYRSTPWETASVLARDMAARPMQIACETDKTPYGHALWIPNFTADPNDRTHQLGVFCPLVTMIMPRFDAVFATPEIMQITHSLVQSTAALIRQFRSAGLEAKMSNIHIRQDRFSPLMRTHIDQSFDAKYLSKHPIPLHNWFQKTAT